MTELHVYDFDGTLFQSPVYPTWWTNREDWWGNPLSLTPPCVGDKPQSGWNEQVVASARQSIADPDVLAVVCTGRSLNSFARYRVPELLKGKGLAFDGVYLKDSGKTDAFKKRIILKLLSRHPSIDTVHIWEDRHHHLADFIRFVEKLGRTGHAHPVQTRQAPCELTPEAYEALRAEGWLSKTAGIFKAPPAMLKEIGEWVTAQVAANELAYFEKALAEQKQERARLESQRNYIQFREALARLKDALPSAGTRDLAAAYKQFYKTSVGVWGFFLPDLKQDSFTGLPARRPEIVRQVTGIIDQAETRLENTLSYAERHDIPRTEATLRELKRWLQPGVHPLKEDSVRKDFPIDLSGWYIDEGILEKSRLKELEGYAPLKQKDPVFYQQLIEGAAKSWKKLPVVLTQKLGIPSAGAVWDPTHRMIRIRLPQHTAPDRALQLVQDALEHELQHFGQSLMSSALSLGNPGFTGRHPQPGMPSRHIKTPGFNQQNRGEYFLDDVEFYPNLLNAIRDIRRTLDNLNDLQKEFQKPPLTLSEQKGVFQFLVGESNRSSFGVGGNRNSFFLALHGRAKDKWKKAVSEAYKAIFQGGKVARRPSEESQQYQKDIRGRDKHVEGARKALKGLLPSLKPYAEQAKVEAPGDPKTQGRLFVKLTKTHPLVTAFLDKWVAAENQHPQAYSWRGAALYHIRDVLLGTKPLKDSVKGVEAQAFKGYEAQVMAEAQKPLREHVPEEFRAFLPKNIVVDIDNQGQIKRITDRFENEHENLGKKIARMRDLVGRYNKIARKVKQDLRSADEMTRLSAMITAIIMETGIRPGQEGNGVVKTVDGVEVKIETFGAITLGPGHIRFVRENFVELEFLGKKGSTNTATLSDAALIKVLKSYVDQALKSGTPYVFVNAEGEPYSYTHLQKYFRANFGDLNPTDFRKLKATETILHALRDEQTALYERIRSFAEDAKDDLKQRVVAEVVATFEAAITRAQAALSHDNAATTVGAYINPEIVLRFLSQGRVDDSLETAILSGKTKLVFDPQTFLMAARGKVARSLGALLLRTRVLQ